MSKSILVKTRAWHTVLIKVAKKRSIHSRISWTAVTHAMDDDTGVPKVRWNHSKIEDMYLSALNCKRQKVYISGIWMAIRQKVLFAKDSPIFVRIPCH